MAGLMGATAMVDAGDMVTIPAGRSRPPARTSWPLDAGRGNAGFSQRWELPRRRVASPGIWSIRAVPI